MVNNFKRITLSLLLVYCWFMVFVEGCQKNEREALLSFEKDLVFPYGTPFPFSHGNNTDDEDCCMWPYVSCNKDGHLTSFDLVYRGLEQIFGMVVPGFQTGSAPLGSYSVLNPSLQQLRYLEQLRLSGIDFGGARIPDWIGSFTKLSSLDLSHCNFSGRLPVGLLNLVHLEQLDLSYNKLEGPIPEALGNVLTILKSINLGGNLFQGGIPASLGNLVRLETLDLNSNILQGGIPASVGKLCFLWGIDLSSNCFTGDLKDLFRNLSSGCTRSSLNYLDLSTNQITGTIPDTIITFSSLAFLSLASNKLNGTISPNIGLMSHLSTIDLMGNSLSGVLNETHFINLRTLEFLDLSNNADCC